MRILDYFNGLLESQRAAILVACANVLFDLNQKPFHCFPRAYIPRY